MKEKAPVVLSDDTLTKAVRLNDFVDRHGPSTERGRGKSIKNFDVGDETFVKITDFGNFIQQTAIVPASTSDRRSDASGITVNFSEHNTPVSKVEAVFIQHSDENIKMAAGVALDGKGRGHNVTVRHEHPDGSVTINPLTGERAERAATIIVNRAARHIGGVIVAKTKKDLEEV